MEVDFFFVEGLTFKSALVETFGSRRSDFRLAKVRLSAREGQTFGRLLRRIQLPSADAGWEQCRVALPRPPAAELEVALAETSIERAQTSISPPGTPSSSALVARRSLSCYRDDAMPYARCDICTRTCYNFVQLGPFPCPW